MTVDEALAMTPKNPIFAVDQGYAVLAAEVRRLRDEKQQAIAHIEGLRTVLSELDESCESWSEYDVPLGIVERIKSALAKARGGQ